MARGICRFNDGLACEESEGSAEGIAEGSATDFVGSCSGSDGDKIEFSQ